MNLEETKECALRKADSDESAAPNALSFIETEDHVEKKITANFLRLNGKHYTTEVEGKSRERTFVVRKHKKMLLFPVHSLSIIQAKLRKLENLRFEPVPLWIFMMVNHSVEGRIAQDIEAAAHWCKERRRACIIVTGYEKRWLARLGAGVRVLDIEEEVQQVRGIFIVSLDWALRHAIEIPNLAVMIDSDVPITDLREILTLTKQLCVLSDKEQLKESEYCHKIYDIFRGQS